MTRITEATATAGTVDVILEAVSLMLAMWWKRNFASSRLRIGCVECVGEKRYGYGSSSTYIWSNGSALDTG